MKKVIRLNDGSTYIADMNKDICVYEEHLNGPGSATDIYAHETKKHGFQYYTYHWSNWQNSRDYIEGISKECAQRLISEECDGFGDEDLEVLIKVGLAEETA